MGILSSLFGGSKTDENRQEKQDKKNFEILKYDGMRARNMHQLGYAIKCFEQASAIQEDNETLQELANAYIQTGRIDDARITLDRLIDINPDDIQLYLSLAQVCYMQEDYESMRNAAGQAINIDETNAYAYYAAGQAEHGLKNDLQAIVMLTKAIAHDEHFTRAYLLRGEILWKMNQLKEAADDAGLVLSTDSDNEDALLLMGKIQISSRLLQEAETSFNRILEINPFNEKAYLLKGKLLSEQNELDKAIELYTEGLELMPQSTVFYQERGHVRLLKGDKEGSIEDMKKAIELNPEQEKSINGEFKN